MNNHPLKIIINAQLIPGQGSGGIEQFLIGVIHALGQLDDGNEEYLIVGPWQEPDWLKPYLGPNQQVISSPKPQVEKGPWESTKKRLGVLRRPASYFWQGCRKVFGRSSASSLPPIGVSDGFFESLGADVIHFPYQSLKRCQMPMIFNPHDLQHVHFPHFFTPSNLAWRQALYPAGCRLADTVIVSCDWVKQDIVRHYGIEGSKVQVIPVAPPTQAYSEPTEETLKAVRSTYKLPRSFAFYPASTWEHKNHLRLLDALAFLRDHHGLVVPLVCTGFKQPAYWEIIEQRLMALNLKDQVQFLGMIPPADLRALYRLATFVVVPTLFEADSQPIFEAWQEKTPVTCSTVTSLPEQVGDAALLFDPLVVGSIASAIKRMATDEDLRRDLIECGKKRLLDFDWNRTAKAYRAVYRRAGHRSLSEEDRWLLEWDWMKGNHTKGRDY